MAKFQTVDNKHPDRTDHVWMKCDGADPPKTRYYRCVLCGAVTDDPPDYPTPKEWTPKFYDEITAKDRELCPPRTGLTKQI